jgi:hypothetical protein
MPVDVGRNDTASAGCSMVDRIVKLRIFNDDRAKCR